MCVYWCTANSAMTSRCAWSRPAATLSHIDRLDINYLGWWRLTNLDRSTKPTKSDAQKMLPVTWPGRVLACEPRSTPKSIALIKEILQMYLFKFFPNALLNAAKKAKIINNTTKRFLSIFDILAVSKLQISWIEIRSRFSARIPSQPSCPSL